MNVGVDDEVGIPAKAGRGIEPRLEDERQGQPAADEEVSPRGKVFVALRNNNV